VTTDSLLADSANPFIARWKDSAASEPANSQLFLGELCDLLGVARPQPAQQDESQNNYVFEKRVGFNNGDGLCGTRDVVSINFPGRSTANSDSSRLSLTVSRR
jgi:hypothetical protein